MLYLAIAALAAGRRLSYTSIAGYAPGSSVYDHNMIDGDQAAIEEALGRDPPDFTQAGNVYMNGGNSKSYATITLSSPLPFELGSGYAVSATTSDGTLVEGSAYTDAAMGSDTIKLKYPVGADGALCRVGGMDEESGLQVTGGCIADSGTVSAGKTQGCYDFINHVCSCGGTESECVAGIWIEAGCTSCETPVDLSYDSVSNNNGRTIYGFSEGANSKMYECSIGCPYHTFEMFYDYYGSTMYANDWVTAALTGSDTDFAHFATTTELDELGEPIPPDDVVRVEGVKKGTAYMNVWMYVVREFEDAIDDCTAGCLNCNDDPVHAWDEGVAFYTGALEGTDGSGSGKLIYNLADKRCQNYNTCVDPEGMGPMNIGTSWVNKILMGMFSHGQYLLQSGQCKAVRKVVEDITAQMTVPLVQGTLRYAYKVSRQSGSFKEKAEGATFAASVLPQLAWCSPSAAETVASAMKLDGDYSNNFDMYLEVKSAFEANYACLNITCADVGGLYTGSGYYDDADPCQDEVAAPCATCGTGTTYNSLTGTCQSDCGGGLCVDNKGSKKCKKAFNKGNCDTDTNHVDCALTCGHCTVCTDTKGSKKCKKAFNKGNCDTDTNQAECALTCGHCSR